MRVYRVRGEKADSMAKKPSTEARDSDIATRQEIDEAINSLSAEDLVRLKRFAEWRVRGIGRGSSERGADELLQDAVMATLAGCEGNRRGRRWNMRVDFVKHLTEYGTRSFRLRVARPEHDNLWVIESRYLPC